MWFVTNDLQIDCDNFFQGKLLYKSFGYESWVQKKFTCEMTQIPTWRKVQKMILNSSSLSSYMNAGYIFRKTIPNWKNDSFYDVLISTCVSSLMIVNAYVCVCIEKKK